MSIVNNKERGKNNNKLSHLKKLTENLPPFPREIDTGMSNPHFKEHEMSCGTSLSWNLLNKPEIACAHWFMSNGTQLPAHVHEEREWKIIYKGSLFLKIEDEEEIRLTSGEYRYIEPGVVHSARTIEDCWFVAIVIPKSKDWPTSTTPA